MQKAAFPEGRFEFTHEPWHGLYWDAWNTLRFDRHYGAMGGQGPIPYAVVSRYAADNGIDGEDFWMFRVLMSVIDTEWLAHTSETDKAEKKEKGRDGRRSQT